jgi:hypothetical protein
MRRQSTMHRGAGGSPAAVEGWREMRARGTFRAGRSRLLDSVLLNTRKPGRSEASSRYRVSANITSSIIIIIEDR